MKNYLVEVEYSEDVSVDAESETEAISKAISTVSGGSLVHKWKASVVSVGEPEDV